MWLVNYTMHCIDHLITLVSVCMCVCKQIGFLERLCPQFFTHFHQIVHATGECGQFDACL